MVYLPVRDTLDHKIDKNRINNIEMHLFSIQIMYKKLSRAPFSSNNQKNIDVIEYNFLLSYLLSDL